MIHIHFTNWNREGGGGGGGVPCTYYLYYTKRGLQVHYILSHCRCKLASFPGSLFVLQVTKAVRRSGNEASCKLECKQCSCVDLQL